MKVVVCVNCLYYSIPKVEGDEIERCPACGDTTYVKDWHDVEVPRKPKEEEVYEICL